MVDPHLLASGAPPHRQGFLRRGECGASRRPPSRIVRKKERKKTDNPREGWEDGTPPPHRDFKGWERKKERKKTDNPRDGINK